MVARPDGYNALAARYADIFHPIFGGCAFYLYTLLRIFRKDSYRMFKKIAILISAIVLSAISLFAFREMAGNSPSNIIKHSRLQDKLPAKGNTLIFRVNYLGLIPSGLARLEDKGEELYQGRRVSHLSAHVRPLSIYSGFFNGWAEAHSYIDTDKLCTLKFMHRLILPNKPEKEKEIFYDQENNFMELKGVKRKILPGTQDGLSAIFYIRRQEIGLGKTFDLNINTNQKNYQLYIKVVKREEYILGKTRVGAWVLDVVIRRRDKNPYHRTTMKIWILDNPSKIPILIKAMTNVGPITARLTDVE